jgi:hypothetical protein
MSVLRLRFATTGDRYIIFSAWFVLHGKRIQHLDCPYSLGIVGVKSITQLNYDRSISPFNIQDDFAPPNFTLDQVRHLLEQYTAEVGQAFEEDVIKSIHWQTAG